MQGQSDLRALLSGACAADERAREAAFEELLSLVMICIRATMGRRLRDHRESADVCQSVARSFVEDYQAGKIRFDTEAALVGYLQKVVRTKMALLARHDGALKRSGPLGGGARSLGSSILGGAAAPEGRSGEGPPSYAARGAEAYDRAVAGLSQDEQTLLRLRSRGLSWERIAQEVGKDAGAVRQQFSRLQRRMTGVVDPGGSSEG